MERAATASDVQKIGEHFLRFDEMTWPRYDYDLTWRLVFAPESVQRKDYAYIASVMSAYNELIQCGRAKRERVTQRLRAAGRER